MLKFYDVEQNSDIWYALRAGKLTSSNLGKVMANFGKAFGEPAKKLAVQIAIEQITGQPISNDYSNAHMERGHEQEPIARMLYEEETFSTVSNGGFYGSDTLSCSPDGLVFDCGVIEIKSVIESVHYANVKRQNVDPAVFRRHPDIEPLRLVFRVAVRRRLRFLRIAAELRKLHRHT